MVIAKDTTEVIATTADVYLGGVILGHTQGAITITVNKATFNVNVNDFGPNVPVSTFSLGTGASIEIPLAQYDTDILLEVIPEAVAVSGTAAVYVGDTTGTNLLNLAKSLTIAPKDGSPQWSFPAAFVSDEFSVPFQLDEQTIMNVTFTAVPDPNNATASGSVFRVEPNAFF